MQIAAAQATQIPVSSERESYGLITVHVPFLDIDRGEIISNLGYSTSFLRNQKQQCRNRVRSYKNLDILSLDSPRKSIEEYWFLAPMLRLAIFLGFVEYFFSETLHHNLPVARAK